MEPAGAPVPHVADRLIKGHQVQAHVPTDCDSQMSHINLESGV